MSVVAGIMLGGTTAHAAFESKEISILDFSWDTPSAPILSAQLSATPAQRQPLDGIVTDLLQNNPTYGYGDPRDLYAWKAWGASPVGTTQFSQSINAVTQTHEGRLNNNLLRFNVAGQQLDWFDGYAGVLANAQLASSLSLHAGIKGILLDTEYYPNVSPGQPFSYADQPQKNLHTFAEYQQRARLVGGQFMAALKSQNPEIHTMLTYGYLTAGTNLAALPNEPYGLLPSFLDGMLDQAGPSNVIYDGFENAYGYNSTTQYDNAYKAIRTDSAALSNNPVKFAQNYRASFGFWLDRGPGGQSVVWDSQNIANNQYSPAQFQFAIQEAVKRSEQYVWMHSEIAGWWRDNIPQPYIDALKDVRKIGKFERFAGTTKDTTTWEQHTEVLGSVSQNNNISIDAVNALFSSQADYTTKALTLEIGGIVSVEVTNNTSTANSGTSRYARSGLIVSDNSGGTSTSALLDTRALMLLWSNNDNALQAGVNDTAGLNQFSTLASQDHPNGTNWIYQIERLSATTAKFSVMDSNGGALIGTPQILSFAGMPANLSISLFAQSGDATFKNVWVASAVYSDWTVNGSGDWNDTANWSFDMPNGTDKKVLLGRAIDSARTVCADVPITIGALRFDNADSYQITGQGSLMIDVTGGNGSIEVLQGHHKINLPLILKDNTIASIAAGASLKISEQMTRINGATLTKTGTGTLSIEAAVLSAAGGEAINLMDGALVVESTSAASVRDAIFAGQLSTSNLSATLGYGAATSGGSVLVHLTMAGDANLDGTINSTDFNALAMNFNATDSIWTSGDFNYDGRVNALDFNALASGFGNTFAAPSLGAVVPEPSLFTAFGMAAMALLTRVR